MNRSQRRGLSGAILIAVVAGTLVAGVLALLTFGVQATQRTTGLPVAIAVSEGPGADVLLRAAEEVGPHAGEALEVTVTSAEAARAMLHDKDIYGILELGAGAGEPQARVIISGAVNPAGTQGAQHALTRAGEAVLGALAEQGEGRVSAVVSVEQVSPVGPAGRAAPLAISALAWIGCLVTGIALTVLGMRGGSAVSARARLLAGAGAAALVTAVAAGYLALWDSALPLGASVLGMILLTSLAFAAVQGGLLHLLGIKAVAILAPLYLMAPAVGAQVPEMLHPAYRDWLWSWTPFRFPTEALRSLLAGTPDAPDVTLAVWVLGGLLVVGLVLLAIPRRSAREQTEAHTSGGIVDVRVNEAERLPRP